MKNIIGANAGEVIYVSVDFSKEELKNMVRKAAESCSCWIISEGSLSSMSDFVVSVLHAAYRLGLINFMPIDVKVKIVDDKAYIYNGDILIDDWIDTVWK